MSEQTKETPIDLGIYGRGERAPWFTGTEAIALGLSALWLLGVSAFFLVIDGDGPGGLDSLRFVMTIIAIFMPVAMIWVAAAAARSSRVMREESERLQAAVDAMRNAYVQSQQASAAGSKPSVEKKLEEIASAQRKTEQAIATFTTTRQPAPDPQADKPAMAPAKAPEALPVDAQGRLELGTPADARSEPVNVSDFLRALNFPESPEDKEGFRALRRALRDRQTAQLVQASQDVLTLLSQDGIFMDDLTPDLARPEVWRRFAQGERGRTVAALGGVRDRSCLALAAGRMKTDPVFRDAVHHFLRKFDQMLASFEPTASDQELVQLADTRTARAFMLLGRVAGTFD